MARNFRNKGNRGRRRNDGGAFKPNRDSDSPAGPGIENPVIFVSADGVLREDLVRLLRPYGYDLYSFSSIPEASRAMNSLHTLAIIVDMHPEERRHAMTIAGMKQEYNPPVPVVFLSDEDHFDARLEAVRFGADAYLKKPVSLNGIIRSLDGLLEDQHADPYRVLIADHDEARLDHHRRLFLGAGMEVDTITDPVVLLDAMAEFIPDLVLMELYFPTCLGMELAAMIRQEREFQSVPIIFHSEEQRLDRRLAAMSRGGDDFIYRPVPDDYLLASVRSRAERHRRLRKLMVTDGLTGLLDHTNARLWLEREAAQAERRGRPLSIALVDIDKFKTINDRYGHAAGDQVIKSLARLLKYRTRTSDEVARYGGEEFLVILRDSNSETTKGILDRICSDFSEIEHLYGEHKFRSTFSCGIATLTPPGYVPELLDAADQGLYQAKGQGGNRVMITSA